MEQKWYKDKCQCECKKSIKYCAFEEDYGWNLRAGACGSDKYYEIVEYLKDCECMKSLTDDIAFTCDEIGHTNKGKEEQKV